MILIGNNASSYYIEIQQQQQQPTGVYEQLHRFDVVFSFIKRCQTCNCNQKCWYYAQHTFSPYVIASVIAVPLNDFSIELVACYHPVINYSSKFSFHFNYKLLLSYSTVGWHLFDSLRSYVNAEIWDPDEYSFTDRIGSWLIYDSAKRESATMSN